MKYNVPVNFEEQMKFIYTVMDNAGMKQEVKVDFKVLNEDPLNILDNFYIFLFRIFKDSDGLNEVFSNFICELEKLAKEDPEDDLDNKIQPVFNDKEIEKIINLKINNSEELQNFKNQLNKSDVLLKQVFELYLDNIYND